MVYLKNVELSNIFLNVSLYKHNIADKTFFFF